VSEPSFSICIPNYNYGRFIGDTIQSVLDQTYQNFEIIVADNASTDNSVDVVQSFKDDRIRLIQNAHNIGFAPNLQKATMFATKEFINLLSSDDQMKPTALEEYAKAIVDIGDSGRRALIVSDAEGFDNSGIVTRIITKASDRFSWRSLPADTLVARTTVVEKHQGRVVLRDILKRLDTVGVFCSVVYHRSLWEAVEGYNSVRTIGPDKHFCYKVLSLDPTVIYIRKPLFRYRDYVSTNRAALQTTIRHPIDNYLNLLEFGNEEFLRTLGLHRKDLIKAMLDHSCLRESLVQIGVGNYGLAFRLLAFAFATFPGQALRMRRTYLAAALLSVAPLSRLIGPALRRLYRQFESNPERPLVEKKTSG
jgi:glycosyltransferase involved in cell wall biosynthesis